MSAIAPAVTPTTSLWSRFYGFGSVFGKTLRDSRRATLLVAALLALTFIGVSRAIVSEFATLESRQELGDLIRSLPPILQGLAGKVVNVETLGGYLQYKYGTFFPLVVSLWSIIALSGTLAGEARRGSLEFVATTARSRRRIALEKLSGHVFALAITMVVVFLAIAIAGNAFPVLPGDEIGTASAAGYALWLGILSLAAGSVAFALGPFLGRGSAAGIAGAIMFAGFILNGYQAAIPAIAPLANLTWFGWTAGHIALAGVYDWASVALVAVVTVVPLAIGVEAFARRDIGVTTSIPTPAMPRTLLGLGGPIGRTIGHALPSAIAWGLGIGLFGLVIAASATGFVDQLVQSPDFVRLLSTVFPGIDFVNVGGFLQLLFIEFGLILAGLAAATLVAAWASDETSGRFELLLATPLSRGRWIAAGGTGMHVNVVLIVALAMVGIAVGTLSAGGDITTPVMGTMVLGIYAAALVGIGVAVGGVLRTRLAAPIVVVVTVVTWLLQLLGPLLGLPQAVRDLALTAHLGQPMVGVWDLGGVAACLTLAVGGVALGVWGLQRRDLAP